MRLQLITGVAAIAAITAFGEVGAQSDEDDWRIALDSLVYSDTDNVVIVSPQVAVHRAVDEDGGSASARAVVDVVSAASVDVVSQATGRFSEVRTEVDLGFSKALGKWLPSFSYRYSHEPDYGSNAVGVGLQRDFFGKDTTIRLGYDLSLDDVGYTGTGSDAFNESLMSQTMVASLTQVVDPKTVVRGVYTLSLQDGYMEKPYRFVPLFDQAGIAAAMSDGVTLDLSTFDRYRLPMRPAEEVPDRRVGHAFALRALRYVEGLPGSLRLDYQIFVDSWGVRGDTIEPGVQWKMSDNRTLSFYGRLYAQQAASFWRREYVVDAGEVPRYRTLDRDLSRYYVLTGGSRLEWRGASWSVYVDASAMDTIYTDYLFLRSRMALIGQAGFRWSP